MCAEGKKVDKREETEKTWKRSYHADLLNYFKNIIPKFSCELLLITELQVEKSEGEGISCSTDKNGLTVG